MDIEKNKWTRSSRKELFKSPYNSYYHDVGKTHMGKDFNYYYIHCGPSAGVIALTDNNQVVLVRQYRYTTNRISLEVPGGSVQGENNPDEVIRQELLEETGYKARTLQLLNIMDVANGYSDDQAYVYLAKGCRLIADQHLEDSEEGMQVELYDIDEIYQLIQTGQVTDAFTLSAFMLARNHLIG
jgi:ADP-ribose pyrophosphatase